MNATAELSCNKTENLCFELVLNFSNISFADPSPRTTHLLRLSQNSASYWIKMTLFFFCISSNAIMHLRKYFCFPSYTNGRRIELIDFTDEDQYQSLAQEQFQVRYGSRSSTHNEEPYHLFRDFLEQ